MIRHKTVEVTTHFRAAGCFCLVADNVLLIQRQRQKPFPLHWGIPSGKLETGETPRECIMRELGEELDLSASADQLHELSCSIVDDGTFVFEYTAFALNLKAFPALTLKSDEVFAAAWLPLDSVRKRRVVPFFHNTFSDLLEWLAHGAIKARPQWEPELSKPRRPAVANT